MKIPGFDILDKISEDLSTTVWKANQSCLNRMVAIKILRPNLAADPEEVRNFLAEGRHIAKLKHSNLIAVYDVLSRDGVCFFVIEHVEGVSVAQMLKQLGKIRHRKAMEIVRDTAEALGYAWKESHIVHRNIKPENILVDEDGCAKVSFIGLAKIADPLGKLAAGSGDWSLVGTPNYMSPEQAGCSPNLDCRTDMYALGATLYHMVTGKMPFEEFDPMVAAQRQISDFLRNPRDIDPSITPSLAAFITRLMMKERKDRYVNWSEALNDIKRLLAGQVIIRKAGPVAVSTIEPEAKPIVMAEQMPGAGPGRARLHIPVWAQIAAWAGLLFWWCFLSRFMLQYWANR
ncbi:MAG: serine/threonine-protein kinase [Verrucomicrobiota bacterium]|nr:serine/threonine-protein kinase [Verrucomicrobiota bacterium]